MTTETEKNLVFRITEYGLKYRSFTINDLIDKRIVETDELEFLKDLTHPSMGGGPTTPNHLLQDIGKHSGDWKEKPYTLLPTAIYNYVDYLEIKEARKFSFEAKQQSNLALLVAVGSMVIGTFIGLLGIITQMLLTR